MRDGAYVVGMRVNLITHALSSSSRSATEGFPVSLTIHPACGLPGEYSYSTDTASLLQMLRQQTDLPATVLEQFRMKLTITSTAKLMGVDLNEQTLTRIGYFVD